MILLATTVFGFRIALAQKKEMHSVRELIHAVNFMECELEYRLTPLPDLLYSASQSCKGPVSQFLIEASKELDKQSSSNIMQCLQFAADRTNNLTPFCFEMIMRLGGSLGCFGLAGQLDGLKAVRLQCEQALEKMAIEREKHLRYYETLGVCAGAALVILLF